MTKIRLLIFLFYVGGVTADAAAQESVYVVANKSVPVDSLARGELLDLYTFEIQEWSDGARVIVFDLDVKGEVKDRFYTYLGRTSSRMKSIWLKRKFSGEGDPPEALETEEEMLSKIASTPGAVGFVSARFVSNEVKILVTISIEDELL